MAGTGNVVLDEQRDYGTVSGQSSGFRTDEFSRVQQQVASDAQEVKRLTQTLQRLAQQVGTSSDGEELRRHINSARKSAVDHIQSSKAGLDELRRSASNPEQQLAAKSLVRQVKQAGDECSNAMETLLNRLNVFQTPPTLSDPTYLDSGELSVEGDRAHLLRSPNKEQTMQQQFTVSSEAVEAESRAVAMQDLQRDIVDMHDVMRDLGVMVQSQGETVENLEANVERAHSEVVHGNQQLGKAVLYKKCSRKLCCVICTILTIIFLLIVIAAIIAAVVLSKK
jgi:hypothetical protein